MACICLHVSQQYSSLVITCLMNMSWSVSILEFYKICPSESVARACQYPPVWGPFQVFVRLTRHDQNRLTVGSGRFLITLGSGWGWPLCRILLVVWSLHFSANCPHVPMSLLTDTTDRDRGLCSSRHGHCSRRCRLHREAVKFDYISSPDVNMELTCLCAHRAPNRRKYCAILPTWFWHWSGLLSSKESQVSCLMVLTWFHQLGPLWLVVFSRLDVKTTFLGALGARPTVLPGTMHEQDMCIPSASRARRVGQGSRKGIVFVIMNGKSCCPIERSTARVRIMITDGRLGGAMTGLLCFWFGPCHVWGSHQGEMQHPKCMLLRLLSSIDPFAPTFSWTVRVGNRSPSSDELGNLGSPSPVFVICSSSTLQINLDLPAVKPCGAGNILEANVNSWALATGWCHTWLNTGLFFCQVWLLSRKDLLSVCVEWN